MDFDNLPDRYLDAGREYLQALIQLGLKPELLTWVRVPQGLAPAEVDPLSPEEVRDNLPFSVDALERPHKYDWMLLLGTSVYDTAGPLVLTKLIVTAYNASITPQEIKPFLVRLQSLKTDQVRGIIDFLSGRMILGPIAMSFTDEVGRQHVQPLDRSNQEVTIGDMTVHPRWVYQAGLPFPSYSERKRQFKTFANSIMERAQAA